MASSCLFSAVFDRGAESAVVEGSPVGARLTREEESAAIADVIAGGSAGVERLALAYAPLLRGTVARYCKALGDDDARAVALETLVAVCHRVGPDGYLAGLLPAHLTDALASETGRQAVVPVPKRMLTRYLTVTRASGGAEPTDETLKAHAMARESFEAITAALWAWGSLEAQYEGTGAVARAFGLWGGVDDFAAAEDRVLVDVAFRSVDDRERSVVRAAYGFAGYRPQSDAEIAGEGWAGSRQAVQRTRSRALGKMREALGVTSAA